MLVIEVRHHFSLFVIVLCWCCFVFMLFQGAKDEQAPPSTHQRQYHSQALIQMIVWIGNPDGVSFWLGLHFLHPAQSLAPPRVKPVTTQHSLRNCVDHPVNTLLRLRRFVSFSHGLFIN